MNIALYMRLSNEDDNKKESNSIKSQRDMLREYALNKYGKSKIVEFVDDGYTGTNFNRPQFINLINSVKEREINTIIVKDLSRLGRNYIEVMNYIEEVFPTYNIKFISINDNINTGNKSSISSGVGLETSFKTIIHHFYSKDLSEKVKSSLKIRAMKGEYVQKDVFYGYKKSDTEKNKLVIDGEASKIVRYIFDLAIKGLSTSKIAKILNDEKIETPMEYMIKTGKRRKEGFKNKSEAVVWRSNKIWKILKDERYTGKLIVNKKERVAVGSSKARNTSKKNWVVTPNAFQPIVTDDEFLEAQKVIKSKKKSSVESGDVFVGKLVCGKCSHNLRRYKYKDKVKFYCNYNKNTSNSLCFDGYIQRDILEKLIIERLDKELRLFINLINIQEKQNLNLKEKQKKLNIEKDTLISDEKRLKSAKIELMEALVEENITEDLFSEKRKLIENKLKDLLNKKELILKKLKEVNSKINDNNSNDILEVLKMDIYNRDIDYIILEFVNRAIVYDKDCIEIRFNIKKLSEM